MADNLNASFIPKKAQKPVKKIRRTRRIYLLSYLSYVLFFGALLATVAIYFYSIQISKSLEAARADLIAQDNKFTEEQVEEVKTMEKKLIATQQLLDEMVAVSRIFEDIEATLASDLYLNGFNYEYMPNNSSLVTLSGKADEFGQLLYQRDVFNMSQLFADAEITHFDYSTGADLDEKDAGSSAESISGLLLDGEGETISFTFQVDLSNGQIEYQPRSFNVDGGVENQVTSIRAGESLSDSAEFTSESNENINN